MEITETLLISVSSASFCSNLFGREFFFDRIYRIYKMNCEIMFILSILSEREPARRGSVVGDLVDGVVLTSVLDDLHTDFIARFCLVDGRAIHLDRVDHLDKVACVAQHVDPVARSKRPAGHPDAGYLDLAEVMGHRTDFFFAHRWSLLLIVRAGLQMAVAQGDPRAAVALDPVSKLEQGNVESCPATRASYGHGIFLLRLALPMNEGEARPSPRYGLGACIDYARINRRFYVFAWDRAGAGRCSGLRLFDEASQEHGVFDVEVFASLESDGDGPVDDVEGPMPLDLTGV